MSATNVDVGSKRNESIASKTTISCSISQVSQSVQDFKLDDSTKPRIPYRYFISIAGTASLFLIFSTRSVLSVAMVAMVRKDEPEVISRDNSTIIEPMWEKVKEHINFIAVIYLFLAENLLIHRQRARNYARFILLLLYSLSIHCRYRFR